MRLFKPNVEKMLKRRDVKGLLKALDDKDRKVAEEAAKALGQIGDVNVAYSLVQKLNQGWTILGTMYVWSCTSILRISYKGTNKRSRSKLFPFGLKKP